MEKIVVANKVPFDSFCEMLEIIQKKKERHEKTNILDNFISDFKIKASETSGDKDTSLFPILRLLLPKNDRERGTYNMQETKLGGVLVKILSLSKKSPDVQKLLNFRSNSKDSWDSDLPGVAYTVLKNRIAESTTSLTIGQINNLLDKIASAEVGNKAPVLEAAFGSAMKNLSAKNLKWFLRLILKDLKLGLGHKYILDVFHPDAPEHYESFGDLSKVCEDLGEGNTRPIELGIQVFYAVSPMLLERLDITDVSRLSPSVEYYLENKFDGERFQIHMQNGNFEYFSRKGFKYGEKYGTTYESGTLTPLLKNSFNANITSFILDGEMMGWHKENKYFGTQAMAFDVKKLTENSKFRPCFCVYDILYYNGRSLSGPPEKGGLTLKERLQILDTVFTDVEGVIQHSARRIVNDNSQILDALNDAIDSHDEGIVVKDVNSFYYPGRRNAGWYKIKPEYTEGAMTDLDLVIIGADEAESKKQGRAKCFHVAGVDDNNGERIWVCVGRVATGVSHTAREELCLALERRWSRAQDSTPPSQLVFNRAKPDFWILPEHSTVLQVRASELIRSSEYGTTHTFRFSRIIRIREDKPIGDVMTINQFNNLVNNKGSVVKLSMKRINPGQIDDPEVKQRKKRPTKEIEVAAQFHALDVGPVDVTSKALLGRKLCVLSDDEECTKTDLIKIIKSHGGIHVENYGRYTWCCVAGRINSNVSSLIESKKLDILPTSWLRCLPHSDNLCSLKPLEMLSIKRTTKLLFGKNYDAFGDSYTEPTNVHILRKTFEKMDNEPKFHPTVKEMLDIDRELFDSNINPYSFLRPCFIYSINIGYLNELKAKLYGASMCDIYSKNLTHVVVSKKFNEIDIESVKSKTNALLVSENWLIACFTEGKLIPEKEFLF